MESNFSLLDEHELLDVCAKTQVCVGGIRYVIMFKDADTLRHTIRQLRNIVLAMNDIIMDEFDR